MPARGRRPPEGAPDSAEPLLGWRVWLLDSDRLLKPLAVSGQPWTRGVNEARCHLGSTRHRAPGRNCVCGFNALHRIPEDFRGDAGYAIGAIAAWGEVDVYRTGFRAQFACVLGLLADAPPGTLHESKLIETAAAYGVPALPPAELRAHAGRHASAAGEALLPGVGARRRRADGGGPPLPVGATAAAFSGRGVQLDAHLAIDHDGRTMRLGPTPALAALASDRVRPAAEPGAVLAEGAPLLVAEVARSRVLSPAPVAGTVLRVNDGVPILEEGPAGEGWLVELRLEAESLDDSSIAWGRRAAEAYRELVLAAGSDADLLLLCAEDPVPESALLDAREAGAWLRAFAQQLDAAIASDASLGAAIEAIGLPARFAVAGVGELTVAAPGLGARRWVRARDPGPSGGEVVGAGLRIELGPDALRRYWSGGLGLAPEEVSSGELPSDRRAPLHLLAGERGTLLLVRSLHQRLFPSAREILRGLGNPWFRAGDAVSDPVRNLEVLAGFERPDGLAGAA